MKSIWNLTVSMFLTVAAAFSAPSLAQSWEMPTQQQMETRNYVQFLNNSYQGLKVELKTNDLREALKQLDLLEGHLQGDFQLGIGSLHDVKCTKIVCGGGGGSCTTCLH